MNPIADFSAASMTQAGDMAEVGRQEKVMATFKAEAEKLGSLSGKDKADKLLELQKTAQDFESMFIHMMFKQMRAALPKSDFFGNSKSEEIFTDMKDVEMSKGLAKAGGLGLAPILVAQLQNKL